MFTQERKGIEMQTWESTQERKGTETQTWESTQERKGTEMQTWESTQGSQHSIEKQGPVDYLFPPSFLLQTLMM